MYVPGQLTVNSRLELSWLIRCWTEFRARKSAIYTAAFNAVCWPRARLLGACRDWQPVDFSSGRHLMSEDHTPVQRRWQQRVRAQSHLNGGTRRLLSGTSLARAGLPSLLRTSVQEYAWSAVLALIGQLEPPAIDSFWHPCMAWRVQRSPLVILGSQLL